MTVIVEDFEDIAVTPNSPAWPVAPGFLQVGATGAFAFGSGVSLIAPIPNGNADTAATVGDFDISALATWLFLFNEAGEILTPDVLPSGKAYIGRNVETNGTLTFGFDSDVFRAGAFVNADSRVGVAAYDANGKLISGARINSVAAEDFDENFIQVISKKPIARLEFTGDFVILDDLTFDTDKPNVVKGTKFNDRIEPPLLKTAQSSNDADVILGKAGNDKAFGGDGDDHLDGGTGKDKLHGGDDNDTLVGGKDKDKLWGDDGQDSFLMNDLGAIDTLKDFNAGEDNILLAKSVFTALSLGTLGGNQFDTTASSADVRIIYDIASGALSYDTDGNGTNAAVQFAKLAPGLMLSSENFFVV